MDINLPPLTEQQQKFVSNPARYKLYGGAMGGGKTFALCCHAILLMLDFPGNIGVICRQDMADLGPTTYKTFVDICETYLGGIGPRCPIVKQHHQTENWIEFSNRSRVYFRGLKDTQSLGSWNLGFFCIDEATEASEEHFNMLDSRLRLSRPGIRYFGLLGSNPGLGWVFDYFIEKPKPDHVFIPALPRDNPHLPDDYEQRLRDKWPDSWVRRYLDGEWLAVEGPVLPELDRNVHEIPPFEIPDSWPRYRGLDYGLSAPTACCWAAVSPHADVFIYRGYYEAGLTIKQHAENILALDWGENIRVTAGDPHMRDKSLQRDDYFYSPLDDFLKNGVRITPSKNDILSSVAAIRTLLEIDDSHLHPLRLTHPAPHFYVFSDVPELFNQLQVWQWAPDLRRGVEVPKANKDDHMRDALRYLVVMLPKTGEYTSGYGAKSYMNRPRSAPNRSLLPAGWSITRH